jgi:hypothetical protein
MVEEFCVRKAPVKLVAPAFQEASPANIIAATAMRANVKLRMRASLRQTLRENFRIVHNATVRGRARRIASNIAKLPELLG